MVKSSDGGKSWSQQPGLNDDIHLVDINEADPQRIYVATAQAPYRSDDGGSHWELINEGLERRYTLHISSAPNDADVVLVAVSANARRDDPQFYRSTDGGRGWKLVDAVGNDGDMVVAIDWDPVAKTLVYAGTDDGKIYRSDDGGEHWERIPADLPAIAVGAMIVA